MNSLNVSAAASGATPTNTAGLPAGMEIRSLPSASGSIILRDIISANTKFSGGFIATGSASIERLKSMYPTFPPADAFAISTAAQGAPVIAFSISHSFSTPAPFSSSTASLRISVPETLAFIKIIFPLPTVFSQIAGSASINPMAFQSSGIFTDLK